MTSTLELTRDKIPFWLRGTGKLQVSIPNVNPADPLPRGNKDLISVQFGAEGEEKFEFGRDRSLKVGVNAGARFHLRPIWDDTDPQDQSVLKGFGLEDYLENHPTEVILYLDTGAQGEASLGGKFQYSALTAAVTLDAGADMRYQYLQPAVATESLGTLLQNYFSGLRLPANVTEPPIPGEVIAFEYGGRLKLSASAGLGYELTGSPSFSIGQLKLSERYKLAVLAGVEFGASIAGRFAVEVQAAPANVGPDWARVVVRKAKTKGLRIAADVTVDAAGELRGLPDTPNEFLGAALGVNAKNWLNLVNEAREWSNFETLEKNLDNLAKNFVEAWIAKGFTELKKADEFEAFLKRVHQVVKSYESLEDRAIGLFDGYFNRINVLTSKLDELVQLTSLDRLRGEIDPDLFNVLNQLTDGDPLGWIMNAIPGGKVAGVAVNSLEELRNRARGALDLVENKAHEEIRRVIGLAKQQFGLNNFIAQLKKVDSTTELQALAEERAGFFVQRLIGQAVKGLSQSDLKKAFDRVHAALTQVDNFEKKLYAKLRDAAKHSFHFGLHAEYNRTRQRDALVDVLINLKTNEGKALMRDAGRGDFAKVLAATRPDLVRINHALLTNRLQRESSFNINIEGWHFLWNYSGFDRVIVETEQSIQDAGNGGIIVFTTIEATKEKDRRKNGERTYTNFLVRFLGESGGKVRGGNAEFDKRNQQYMIDVLTGMAATYQILLEDQKTSRDELAYYLSFAEKFGLARSGVTLEALEKVLPAKVAGESVDFGNISADYHVRYNETSLRKLLDVRLDEKATTLIRGVMRRIVLANYTQSKHRSHLMPIGWAYWTEGVRQFWKREGGASFTNRSSLRFTPAPSQLQGLTAPQSLDLNHNQLLVLNTLFQIEDHMVRGIEKLYEALHGQGPIAPRDLEAAVADILDAFKLFDDFDEDTNTVFAIFDELVHAVDNSPGVRSSSLQLTSEVIPEGEQQPIKVSKVFTSEMEVDVADETDRAMAAGAVA